MWLARSRPRECAIACFALVAIGAAVSAGPAAGAGSEPHDEVAVTAPKHVRSHQLEISHRPLTGALGLTPPFTLPQADPAVAAAAVRAALARQAAARKRAALMAPDPRPVVMPIRGAGYETGFGARSKHWAVAHSGLDFSASTGTEAVAVVSGTIRAIFIHPAYGNVVQLVRDDGVEFWYCHLSSTLTRPGQRVRQGQAIALTGDTGNVTGPHLHFEVRVGGVPTDPGDFLYSTPGVAGAPPAWAYAYSDNPPPGFTVIGYPPPKKPEDEEGKRRKPKPRPSATPSRNPQPIPSPTPTDDGPRPKPSPSVTPSPSAKPSPSPSPSRSSGGGATERPAANE